MLLQHIVILNNDETNQRVALYPPTPFSQPNDKTQGEKGAKALTPSPSPYLGEGSGVRAYLRGLTKKTFSFLIEMTINARDIQK